MARNLTDEDVDAVAAALARHGVTVTPPEAPAEPHPAEVVKTPADQLLEALRIDVTPNIEAILAQYEITLAPVAEEESNDAATSDESDPLHATPPA